MLYKIEETDPKRKNFQKKRMIAFGFYHTLILTKTCVLGFGSNMLFQLGLKEEKNYYKPTVICEHQDIKMIACGGEHSCIYKSNGELLLFGNNAQFVFFVVVSG